MREKVQGAASDVTTVSPGGDFYFISSPPAE